MDLQVAFIISDDLEIDSVQLSPSWINSGLSIIEALRPKTEPTVGKDDCAKCTTEASTAKAQGSAESPACAESPASVEVTASTIIAEPPALSPAASCSTVGGGGTVGGASGTGSGGGGCARNLAAVGGAGGSPGGGCAGNPAAHKSNVTGAWGWIPNIGQSFLWLTMCLKASTDLTGGQALGGFFLQVGLHSFI